jgi:hypothetical protein
MRTLPTETVLTRSEARLLGWSDPALSRAVRAGRVLRLRRNQFVVPDGARETGAAPDPRLQAIAAARSCGGSVISHRSAALMHGLPLLLPVPDRPDLTVQPARTGDVQGALLHRATLRLGDVVAIDGAPVTSIARTVVDVARHVPVIAGVVTADAALHAELITAEDLDEVLAACRNWPRIPLARRVLTLADGRAESALESYSRVVIGRLGLPAPELQVRVFVGGRQAGRLDFYWDRYGVAGEADGRSKYDTRPVLTAEKDRQEQMEDPGVVFTRWGWLEARQPSLLQRRLVRAFDRGARRDSSGFPRQWSVRAC